MGMLDELENEYKRKQERQYLKALSASDLAGKTPVLWRALQDQIMGDITGYGERLRQLPRVDFVPHPPNEFSVRRLSYPAFTVEVKLLSVQTIQVVHRTRESEAAECCEEPDYFNVELSESGEAYFSFHGTGMNVEEVSKTLLYRHLRP